MKTGQKLYSVALAATALFLLLALVSSIASAALSTINETQITSSGSAIQSDIYDDIIVWYDYRNGNADIYMYNLSTSRETQITTNESDQWLPAIYSKYIVWQDERNGQSDIYLYDLAAQKEVQITKNESYQREPAIYGNRIVWRDERNEKENFIGSDIYMYDLSTRQETQITTSGLANYPAIYGDRIVWTDSRNDKELVNADIFMYNLTTQQETQITSGRSTFTPAIYGDRTVWYQGNLTNGDIFMYDLSTHQETQITNIGSAGIPSIYGDKIVWYDKRNWKSTPQEEYGDEIKNDDIYIYDLSTQKETQITTNESNQYFPAIYGNRIVWTDERNGYNIYMATFGSSLPVSDFSASPISGNAPLNVKFTDKSTGTPNMWKWDFGDGTNSTEQNPEHTYSTAGNYTVNLTVSNTDGADTKTSVINVQSVSPATPGGFNFFIFLMIIFFLGKKSA